MSDGQLFAAYSVTTPEVVTLPIVAASFVLMKFVNHRLPSGPAVIPTGSLVAASAYSVITPAVGIFPTFAVPLSTNQRLLSGPAAMCSGRLFAGSAYSVITPAVVIF